MAVCNRCGGNREVPCVDASVPSEVGWTECPGCAGLGYDPGKNKPTRDPIYVDIEDECRKQEEEWGCDYDDKQRLAKLMNEVGFLAGYFWPVEIDNQIFLRKRLQAVAAVCVSWLESMRAEES